MRVDSRAGLSALAALAALALAGCAGAPPAAPAAPSRPPAPDPVTVCTNQLTYWAGEQLRGAPDGGFDYQEMGLSHAQFDALAVLVDGARARGPSLSADWVPTRARELCTEIAARPAPTGRSWP
jgi:hypothetical protein